MTTSLRTLTAILLLTFGVVLLYWHVLGKLAYDWLNDGNYSHGFLIIPLALYFAWERRHQLETAVVQPSLFGLVVFAGSILVLMTGLLGSELFLSRISIIGTVAGMVLFLFGWAYLRLLAFPIAFLFLMIPTPSIIFNQIAFPLQLIASRMGEFTIASLGIPVLREGNIIVLAHMRLEVTEACSGIRSLISLITLGIVFGYFVDSRSWVRVLLVLSAVPVAIIANGLRVAGTGIAAQWFGPAAADGFFHEFSGWVVFVAAFGMILVVQQAIARTAGHKHFRPAT